ncbi:1,4-dihydroxy-2-naphthoate octaprenyltransferase [bacterium]|nr:1,4-dihydroxy-2-naphthoate octaprenyltransferase [bacterium]MBU1882328.1 1,4-dihydroxy-2-naphthoate octaprenyltransferase [bacterium]
MNPTTSSAAAPQPNKLVIWLQEIRAPFFTAVIVPVVLASVIAWHDGYAVHTGYFLLTLFASIFLHAGANVINDYADHRSGCDAKNVEYIRPFTGGSRMIQNGLLSTREVLTGAIIFLCISTVLGLILVATKGKPILYLGLIGTFCAVFYTLPPFNLVARGIGELLLGFCFGMLMMLGAYYVQAQTFSIGVVVASIPVTLLIAGVLYINEFPDYVADRDSGKRHLVVRMGRSKAVNGYIAILAGTYLSIIVGVIFKILPVYTLLALITLPKAVSSIKVARQHHSNSEKLAPANAGTIAIHLLTGALLSIGYLIDMFI